MKNGSGERNYTRVSGGFRGGSRGSLKPPLDPNYFIFMGNFKRLNVKIDIGYPHDGRADNTAYRHHRRADKQRYTHDREIDIQMSRNGYILS